MVKKGLFEPQIGFNQLHAQLGREAVMTVAQSAK